MAENQTVRNSDGMMETLDFIKNSQRIDLLNEGSVSLHFPQGCRVIRLKLGALATGLKTHCQEALNPEFLLNSVYENRNIFRDIIAIKAPGLIQVVFQQKFFIYSFMSEFFKPRPVFLEHFGGRSITLKCSPLWSNMIVCRLMPPNMMQQNVWQKRRDVKFPAESQVPHQVQQANT